ncbi:MAG: hypothetical protein Q8L60_10575 [Gammaproteobacteria bacterium]|nr:hypothetical protein [Gammaproteobacteria bacterium]MDP2346792.1 hypothetical protein [Gammaproteobacteria bacterium]
MKEKLLIWAMILSIPSFIIGHLASLPWLTILGALLIIPFGIVAIAGIIWNIIDR